MGSVPTVIFRVGMSRARNCWTRPRHRRPVPSSQPRGRLDWRRQVQKLGLSLYGAVETSNTVHFLHTTYPLAEIMFFKFLSLLSLHFRMVIQANGKDYHSVEIQLGTGTFDEILLKFNKNALVLIPKDKLDVSPSIEEGLKQETETELRNMGGDLIQKAGIYLRLPQVAIASAQVLFQRFFYAKVHFLLSSHAN